MPPPDASALALPVPAEALAVVDLRCLDGAGRGDALDLEETHAVDDAIIAVRDQPPLEPRQAHGPRARRVERVAALWERVVAPPVPRVRQREPRGVDVLEEPAGPVERQRREEAILRERAEVLARSPLEHVPEHAEARVAIGPRRARLGTPVSGVHHVDARERLEVGRGVALGHEGREIEEVIDQTRGVGEQHPRRDRDVGVRGMPYRSADRVVDWRVEIQAPFLRE
ncbi:MAG: hypothetical protein OHK0013_07040 [Sandaracinaceae bacterium]